ncbi:MAG: hypothetical protein H6926_07040 [Chromatiales bacterium]|nr:hypothetical protein [Chromatiales bacterium]
MTENLNQQREQEDKKDRSLLWILLAGVTTLVVGYGAFLIYETWPIEQRSVEKAGSFGDTFGLLTSLFSGLAFASLYVTLRMQSRQLRYQYEELQSTRSELELTRGEMERQRLAMEQQSRMVTLQQFENTFFNLLSMLIETRDKIEFQTGHDPLHGKSAFNRFIRSLSNHSALITLKPLEQIHPNESVMHALRNIYFSRDHEFGEYLRTISNIVQFVDKSNVDDKTFYMSLIRDQLSHYEVIYIYYFAHFIPDDKEFIDIIDRHHIFATPDRSDLTIKMATDPYKPSAYEI